MCVGLWCLTAVYASAKRMRKLTTNAIGGKPVRAQQVADGERLRREIRVFPPQGQTLTKNHQRPNADASVRRVCGWNEVEDTVSPCPPSEDLEDLEQSGKAFNSGEEKAGSIKHICRADTLPTEGFYD